MLEIKVYDYRHEDATLIRQEVFIEEQGFAYEYDEIDEYAKHIVIYEGIPVGVCRVFPCEDNEDEYIIGRLAVRKNYRKKGLGRALLTACEEYTRANHGKVIKLHSQCRAMEFYEKCGYVARGAIEEEEGVLHIWMYKDLE